MEEEMKLSQKQSTERMNSEVQPGTLRIPMTDIQPAK
jgi:hypothetical protein